MDAINVVSDNFSEQNFPAIKIRVDSKMTDNQFEYQIFEDTKIPNLHLFFEKPITINEYIQLLNSIKAFQQSFGKENRQTNRHKIKK